MDNQWNVITSLLAQNRPAFEALGDATRQGIVTRLATTQRLSVGELAVEMELSRPAVSHHIKILKQAGLLVEHRQGTKRYYQPTFTASAESLTELLQELEALP